MKYLVFDKVVEEYYFRETLHSWCDERLIVYLSYEEGKIGIR
jgi:hypothetical protein